MVSRNSQHWTLLRDAGRRYPPRRASRPPQSAFTLVELLVVITIISILASLLLVGAAAARRFMRQSTIKTEVDQLDGSFQEYKQQNGAYPPNAVRMSAANQRDAYQVVVADLKRHFKKAFPRHQEPDIVFEELVGDGRGQLEGGMSPAEAVFFWLGGFSSDARYPISGAGGPAFDPTEEAVEELERRQGIHTFDFSRLGPRDAAGQFSGRSFSYRLNDANRSARQINLWTYTPNGFSQPYHYFDTSRHKPAEYDPIFDPLSRDAFVVPLKTMPAAGGPVTDASQIQYVNPQSFQILHAGIDDLWGDFRMLTVRRVVNGEGLLYPTGPFTEELADTIVNFSTETLEASEE